MLKPKHRPTRYSTAPRLITIYQTTINLLSSESPPSHFSQSINYNAITKSLHSKPRRPSNRRSRSLGRANAKATGGRSGQPQAARVHTERPMDAQAVRLHPRRRILSVLKANPVLPHRMAGQQNQQIISTQLDLVTRPLSLGQQQ